VLQRGRARERAKARALGLERLVRLVVRAPKLFERVARPEFRVALLRGPQFERGLKPTRCS
jgi:hypothetical protein